MEFTPQFIELAARHGKSANTFYAEILLIDAHMEMDKAKTDSEGGNEDDK